MKSKKGPVRQSNLSLRRLSGAFGTVVGTVVPIGGTHQLVSRCVYGVLSQLFCL